MKRTLASSQRGVTLIVGLIMLILITLMVTTAFTLNTGNLKSVGNMQFRNESIAAANKAIEQYVTNEFPPNFMTIPSATTISFDINNDTNVDYRIAVAQPVCVEATVVTSATSGGGACTGFRGGALAGCPQPNWSTLWDMTAQVQDAVSGTSVVVRQGIRLEVSHTQKEAICN